MERGRTEDVGMSDVTSGMVGPEKSNTPVLETEVARLYAAYIRPPGGGLWPKEAYRIAKGLAGRKTSAVQREGHRQVVEGKR